VRQEAVEGVFFFGSRFCVLSMIAGFFFPFRARRCLIRVGIENGAVETEVIGVGEGK